ncbi:MAG TPA: type II toxin-antitoxin system RelE/ParE family toxin [Acidobacteriota bacterium]
MTASLPVKVVRRATREIAEAAKWWTENRPSAPEAFKEELRKAFALISSHPMVGARALNKNLPGVRRIHLSRISYHLYYRVTPHAIEVLALWHTSRGAGPEL